MSNQKNSPPLILGQNKPPQRIPFDIHTAKNVQCLVCDGEIFEQGLMFKKIPKLAIGATEDSYATLPVFICKVCGEVQQELSDLSHLKK